MRRSVLLLAFMIMAAAAAGAGDARAQAAAAGRSASLQGEDPRAFVDNPQIRRFYDLSVATLRPGAPVLDMKAYEARSYAIFHAFGESRAKGGGPGMVAHLKLIPAQVVRIAAEDPKVLDTFDAFIDAMVGPK